MIFHFISLRGLTLHFTEGSHSDISQRGSHQSAHTFTPPKVGGRHIAIVATQPSEECVRGGQKRQALLRASIVGREAISRRRSLPTSHPVVVPAVQPVSTSQKIQLKSPSIYSALLYASTSSMAPA